VLVRSDRRGVVKGQDSAAREIDALRGGDRTAVPDLERRAVTQRYRAVASGHVGKELCRTKDLLPTNGIDTNVARVREGNRVAGRPPEQAGCNGSTGTITESCGLAAVRVVDGHNRHIRRAGRIDGAGIEDRD